MAGITVLVDKWTIIILALVIMAILLVYAYSQAGKLFGIEIFPMW